MTGLVIAQLPIEEKERKQGKTGYRSGYEEFLQSYESFKTKEKIRGRMEYRKMNICQNTQTITMAETIPSIKTMWWLEQVRIPIEKDSDGNNITPDLKTYFEKGSIRKPKVKIGDELTNDVHLLAIISDKKIGAEKALEIKRAHLKIENSLHHVLDDLFREDRSSTRKSKNNLALIRKFADDQHLIAKYVFSGIESFR